MDRDAKYNITIKKSEWYSKDVEHTESIVVLKDDEY